MSADTTNLRERVAVNHLNCLTEMLKKRGFVAVLRPTTKPFPSVLVSDRLPIQCGAAHYWVPQQNGNLRLIGDLDEPAEVAQRAATYLSRARHA